MAKALKKWNGRGHGKYNKHHLSVAAYSQKQAAEIIAKACLTYVSVNEIKVYYSDTWGNYMTGIEPIEPCVYLNTSDGIPKKIY